MIININIKQFEKLLKYIGEQKEKNNKRICFNIQCEDYYKPIRVEVKR